MHRIIDMVLFLRDPIPNILMWLDYSICVCMRALAFMRGCVCMCVCMLMCACMRACIHVSNGVCICVHGCVCACVHVCMCVCMKTINN